VNDIPGVATSVTRVPAVGEEGGTVPGPPRIITSVKDAEDGLVHDKAIEVLLSVARALVANPGTRLRREPARDVGDELDRCGRPAVEGDVEQFADPGDARLDCASQC
jgi:hypothetical protein